jgi:SNF2 family DNA or RNA helicase
MYKFHTKPYQHQKKAFDASWSANHFALFMEMGTGKSKVAIDTIAALFEAGKIDTALILAPKGVFDNWVKAEIPIHLPPRIQRSVLRWQPGLTKKFVNDLKDFALPNLRKAKTLHLFVMNIEALSTDKGFDTAKDFISMNPNIITIVDESTTIKNRQARRTKNVIHLGRMSKYTRILTGSPITKSPMDLFSQCDFLTKNCLGLPSFYAYQNRYAIVVQRTMGRHSFREITGYRRLDELNEKLDTFSYRVLKEDCLDLPKKIYIRREVLLSPEQTKAYAQMKKLALTKLESGELATTQSVLTQIMRLQQICCGFLRTDEEELVPLKNNRLNELLDIADEVQGKAIIWATWSHDIEMIAEALRRRFGPEAAATYYGATPQNDRQDIVERFQDKDSELRFFIGQPKTGGYGITLTAANTMIYYSNSYDLEIRLQSEDRAHRIGQEQNVTYIDLMAVGQELRGKQQKTIDEKIVKALRDKINIAGEVLGEDAKQWLI